VLELEKRCALDDYGDRVVKDLEERRCEDPQVKKDRLELAERQEDDPRIYKELGELKIRRKVEKEAKEAEATAMRKIKLVNIPTTVSFKHKNRSRSPSKSRRSKSARRISEEINLQHSRGVLIDLTVSKQPQPRNVRTKSTPEKHKKESGEAEQQRECVREEERHETSLQLQVLWKEYARCYPVLENRLILYSSSTIKCPLDVECSGL